MEMQKVLDWMIRLLPPVLIVIGCCCCECFILGNDDTAILFNIATFLMGVWLFLYIISIVSEKNLEADVLEIVVITKYLLWKV